MKITIITATFNSEATVHDTLRSVKSQTHPAVEHIIVDGMSSDNTISIVKEYAHVANIIVETDSGIYDAMNKGIRAAKGDVIGILNSDDLYAHERVLERIAQVFEDDKIDGCYADLQYVDRRDTNKVIRTWKSGHYNRRSFYRGWMPPHPTLFLRRRVYDAVGFFNTDLRSAADYELMLRIFVKHAFNVVYIPELIVKMRTGGMSNASFLQRLKANREDRKAWKMNNLQPHLLTLYLKPIRKIGQFVKK